MTNLIIFVVIGLVVFIFIKKDSGKQVDHKKYLPRLAKFLGQELQFDEDEQDATINFEYKGHQFVYAHKEEIGLKGAVTPRATLKAKTGDFFTFCFTERSRTTLRANVETLADVAGNPWGNEARQVPVPKDLQEFNLQTNHRQKATELMADENTAKVFLKLKNKDSVGHPVMPLEILDGEVTLRFQPPGGLPPNLLDIQYNVSVVADYAELLLPIVEKLNELKLKYKSV